ncbi:MAG: tripartite tricarboxylate transporter substrate binding protein [Betaproteobacteria bacterium]|nr:tripartite tricarboxylate transporter substrate binding protein [Betaproteobacteria bacterium]
MRYLAEIAKTWVLITGIAFAMIANAQSDYPNRPVRLVVPFAPGGSTDQASRVLAQKLDEQMGQPVIIDNRPGANSNVGADLVAKSSADGYTALWNSSSIIFNRHIGHSKLNYDLFRDFLPVALTATVPQILVVIPSVPAKNLQEFIAYVRANPGKLNYASVGVGNIGHLTTLLFLNANKLSAEHIPYNTGSQAAYFDLLGGRTQFYFATIASAVPFVKANRMRAIAVTSLERSKALPDVPTISESGMPKFESTAWQGMLVPAKTPTAVINKLNAEILIALKNPDLLRRFEAQGTLSLGSTPQEYGNYLRNEDKRWGAIIREAGIKPES